MNALSSLGVQGSYVKDNQYTNDLVNWMYEQADKSSKAKNSDPDNMEKAIAAKMDGNMTTFYSRYYKLAKNKKETTASRGVRQTVLNMIKEYQKATDNEYVTRAQREVYNVVQATGDAEGLPSVMPITIKDGKGEMHTLSDMQYVEYQTDYNRIYWELVEQTLTPTASTETKSNLLKKAKSQAKAEATSRTLKRIGASTAGSKSGGFGNGGFGSSSGFGNGGFGD